MFAVFELLLSLSSSFCELEPCDPYNLPSRIADRFSLGFVCQGHAKARRDLTVTGILGPTRKSLLKCNRRSVVLEIRTSSGMCK